MDNNIRGQLEKVLHGVFKRTFIASFSGPPTLLSALISEIQPSLNALWVGRLADFKIHALNRVIEDLSEAAQAKKQRVSLTVVGSG